MWKHLLSFSLPHLTWFIAVYKYTYNIKVETVEVASISEGEKIELDRLNYVSDCSVDQYFVIVMHQICPIPIVACNFVSCIYGSHNYAVIIPYWCATDAP